MDTLQDPTLGLLIEVASNWTASTLKTVMMRADVFRFGSTDDKANKQEILRARLLGAQRAARGGDASAHRALLDFVLQFLTGSRTDPEDPPPWFGELREALLGDGYELAWKHAVDDVVDARNVFSRPHETRVEYELRPTDAGPVPLGPEITALEKELEDRGYRVALNHYHQAVDSFSQHRYEASNSQLRAMFEDLLVQLAEAHTDFSKPSDQGGGGQALGKLIGTPSLGPRAGGNLLQGLWQMSHSDGSHPGQSNADETRFRLQVVTAAARLLLHRFPSVA
ncbi:MAG: hypothetical protein IPK24_23745 [Kineosporiaceae bacterium]|nr:hypothetical protein [Kineosporiaceae bacterium]